MKIYNLLPLLLDCMERWDKKPARQDFLESYYEPNSNLIGVLVDDKGSDFYSVLEDLNWDLYRKEVLALDPKREEERVKTQIRNIERLFGLSLSGEVVLFGAFTCMDGYARFDRGHHRVFLGVDESHGRGAYLDILISHELTHVVRESREEVWRGFGLSPQMTHDEFTQNLPVIEHLMGEGFSCVISEILVPGEPPWNYAYQTQESLAQVLEHGPAMDRRIKEEIAHIDGDYGRLYNPKNYGKNMPAFSHYVWAWQWAKRLLKEHAGSDVGKLVSLCSKEFISHAMKFNLERIE